MFRYWQLFFLVEKLLFYELHNHSLRQSIMNKAKLVYDILMPCKKKLDHRVQRLEAEPEQ